MKLNKNGWELKEMALLVGILVLFLIVVGYLIYTFYGTLATREGTVYISLENKIAYAAKDYINDGHKSKSIITLRELKSEGYILVFTDNNDNACDGYVEYEDGVYTPYIKCENFTTRGYNKKLQ